MATRYHELLIEGPRGWTLGFIQGFVRGRGNKVDLLDAEEEGFACEQISERVHELVHRSEETLHLLVPKSSLPVVRRAVKAAVARGRDVKITCDRPLAGARFSFSTVAYSREHASKIRGIFYHLRKGVKLSEETTFDEIVEPSAKGIEAYAPVHEYELRGKGGVEGPVNGVIALYRACRDEPLIQEGAPKLIPVETDC
jgi:hypothetical protein